MTRAIGTLVLALLVGAPDAWAFGFSVEPARVQVAVPAGKRRGQTLTVRNAKPDETIHLTVSVRDIVYLPDGTHEFPPPSSTDWSCASWIQVVPEELDLPPGTSRDVRVSVVAPPEAAGGRYAVIFFETGPSFADEGIGVNFRVGAVVEAVVPGTERPAATMRAVAVVPPAEIRTELFNDGNVLIRPKGSVKVFDADGKKLAQAAFNPSLVGVLPKTLRTFVTTLDAPLPAGAARVKVEVDYGARVLLVGERALGAE